MLAVVSTCPKSETQEGWTQTPCNLRCLRCDSCWQVPYNTELMTCHLQCSVTGSQKEPWMCNDLDVSIHPPIPSPTPVCTRVSNCPFSQTISSVRNTRPTQRWTAMWGWYVHCNLSSVVVTSLFLILIPLIVISPIFPLVDSLLTPPLFK